MNIVRIYTYNFTLEDCNRLSLSITNLNILALVNLDRVGKNGDKQYILKIDSSQLDTLRNMVVPHIDASMRYRVGLPKSSL